MEELQLIKKLVKEFPNDRDLGKAYRSWSIDNQRIGGNDLCRSFPNDADLGAELRMTSKNIPQNI